MKRSLFIFCALSGLCGLSQVIAQETSLQELAPHPHPFLEDVTYPAWSRLTPEQGIIDTRKALADAQIKLDKLAQTSPEEMSFESVFRAFEDLQQELICTCAYLDHLGSVMDSPDMRLALQSLMEEQTKFISTINNNRELWKVIKKAYSQPWLAECSPAQQRYAKQVYDRFRDNGADLPPELQAHKAALDLEHSQLRQIFSEKVLDSTNSWQHLIIDELALDGMTEDWKARAAQAALDKGYAEGYLLTLDYSCMGALLSDCHVEETRKLCWEGQNSVGFGGENDTAPTIDRVMKLRHELAQLLGFANYTDLKANQRMIENSKEALDFVDGLTQRIKPAFERECQELLNFIAEKQGKAAGEIKAIKPWDSAYYRKQLSKERFSFDPEELRAYQECAAVTQGMFDIFQNLFNIEIKEVPSVYIAPNAPRPEREARAEVWEPSVKVYAIFDATSKVHLGSFYMDLFARKSKNAGAWVMSLKAGSPAKEGKPHKPHLAALVCNYPPATATHPSLLSCYDVKVLFHELGHMLHAMLSDVEMRSHWGTNVALDFVELPSQLLEYWVWEPESIVRFTKHHETGAPIPAELIEKMLASRYFMPAWSTMAQMTYAKLDLTMHTEYEKYFGDKDLDRASVELLKEIRIPMTQQAPSLMRGLMHCVFYDYGSGYYSYKWAKVLCADAFSRFKKEGIFNPKTGADFREAILSKGNSKSADELFRDFMGREPKTDALLLETGLIENEP